MPPSTGRPSPAAGRRVQPLPQADNRPGRRWRGRRCPAGDARHDRRLGRATPLKRPLEWVCAFRPPGMAAYAATVDRTDPGRTPARQPQVAQVVGVSRRIVQAQVLQP